MTTLLAEPGADNLWASMPGWGIVADLTPPELVAARSLRVLRKQLAAALALVVLLCAAGYVWAARQTSAAEDQLAASQVTTARLNAENAKYSDVVNLQSATSAITNQLSTLMSTDVDVAGFIERMRAAAPAGTTFTSVALTFNAAAGATSAGTVGGTAPAIGTLSLSGVSRRMVDVASYVTALQGLAGVVNVIPSTNSATKSGGRATWSITAQLTDKLYTHRFKAAATNTGNAGGGH
ncbi:hypothetical protein [uncultured Jatrophihabitans sp.]|uniref:hypothetical protein n=1 Tax=uncultured Jatrophihabitans sp. TaxID=1610747 RepID=UPI0035CC6DDD